MMQGVNILNGKNLHKGIIMKKIYNVALPWYASIIFTVEAESEEEAVRLAKKQAAPHLCSECNDSVDLEAFNGNFNPSVWEIKHG